MELKECVGCTKTTSGIWSRNSESGGKDKTQRQGWRFFDGTRTYKYAYTVAKRNAKGSYAKSQMKVGQIG